MPAHLEVPAPEVATEGPTDGAGAEASDRHAVPLAIVDEPRDPGPRDAIDGQSDRARPRDGRDPDGGADDRVIERGHFSTPVTTTPRMNARWARRNTAIGTAIVISAAAWMSVGCVAYSALYCWMAIETGCSSGLLAR